RLENGVQRPGHDRAGRDPRGKTGSAPRPVPARACVHPARPAGNDVPSGAGMVYSDLGMIVLGAILEEKQGLRLDQYLRERVYIPLGLQETMFRPAQDAPQLLDRIAPTELSKRTG